MGWGRGGIFIDGVLCFISEMRGTRGEAVESPQGCTGCRMRCMLGPTPPAARPAGIPARCFLHARVGGLSCACAGAAPHALSSFSASK